jgi:hypothetical protein
MGMGGRNPSSIARFHRFCGTNTIGALLSSLMGGWTMVDTARCVRCRIYTERSELLFTEDGRPCCITCGLRSDFSDVDASPPGEAWVIADRPGPLEPRVRIAAALMVFATLAFPIAAFLSQL